MSGGSCSILEVDTIDPYAVRWFYSATGCVISLGGTASQLRTRSCIWLPANVIQISIDGFTLRERILWCSSGHSWCEEFLLLLTMGTVTEVDLEKSS
jgi:hypothetical protein